MGSGFTATSFHNSSYSRRSQRRPQPTLAPPPTPVPAMSACSRGALALLSSVFAISGLGLLGLAVGTDYWLYLEEGAVTPLNQSIDVRTSLHSGLWRVCFLAGGWISWISLRVQEWVDVLQAQRTGG